MSASTPRRATVVWIALVLATCATWWLGTDHPFADASVRLAGAVAIVIAFAKAWLVGQDFMELRGAARPLRLALAVWLSVVGSLCVALYAL
jgi:hypothetical protein